MLFLIIPGGTQSASLLSSWVYSCLWFLNLSVLRGHLEGWSKWGSSFPSLPRVSSVVSLRRASRTCIHSRFLAGHSGCCPRRGAGGGSMWRNPAEDRILQTPEMTFSSRYLVYVTQTSRLLSPRTDILWIAHHGAFPCPAPRPSTTALPFQKWKRKRPRGQRKDGAGSRWLRLAVCTTW